MSKARALKFSIEKTLMEELSEERFMLVDSVNFVDELKITFY